MFEAFTPSHRTGKKTKPRSIRLFLEELEGRCLLSNGGLTVGPDGNLWFPDGGNRIGQLNPSTGIIQDFSLPPGEFPELGELTLGPDGNLWFSRVDRMDKINPSSGVVQEYPLPSGCNIGMGANITAGLDGNLWFGSVGRLNRLDPFTGAIKGFAFPANTNFNDIAAGPDGKVWFTEWTDGGEKAIGRIDTQTGSIQEFPTPGAGGPGAITVGAGGNLWFTEDSTIPSTISGSIGRIDATTGQIKEFDLPARHGIFPLMTLGSDGNIWYLGYTGVGAYEIGDLNTSTGTVNTFPFPGPWVPTGITTGPDGNLWLPLANWGQFAISVFDPITGTFLQLYQPGAKSVAPPSGNPAASNGSVSATGSNVSATAGINFLTAVATFTPQVPIASPGQAYQATIQWGDGTTSSIVLTVTENGTYDVTAGHAYQTAGTYTIKVTIGNYNPANPLGDNPVTVFTTANVQALNDDPFAMTW